MEKGAASGVVQMVAQGSFCERPPDLLTSKRRKERGKGGFFVRLFLEDDILRQIIVWFYIATCLSSN